MYVFDMFYCTTCMNKDDDDKLSTAYPTGGHVTRLEHHRRGRPVLLGAVVHQQVQT